MYGSWLEDYEKLIISKEKDREPDFPSSSSGIRMQKIMQDLDLNEYIKQYYILKNNRKFISSIDKDFFFNFVDKLIEYKDNY